jgi:hypothetical protein
VQIVGAALRIFFQIGAVDHAVRHGVIEFSFELAGLSLYAIDDASYVGGRHDGVAIGVLGGAGPRESRQ